MICGTMRRQAEERVIARACGKHRTDQFMVVYGEMIERKMWRNVALSYMCGGQGVDIFLSIGNPLGSSG